ncbi:WecB/TagA/CpsF family glycosyltransferase [Thermoanaerobacterium sp. RBIITD]|uniref:WecB/TagA/CpsF family glycosyltransferase n=1 Tax=Thermoanaerobacterium sp. RBIITD TaxID=1550240 RepID=UPI000BB967E4
MTETIKYIEENLEKAKGNYICVSNVHTTVMAYEDKNYRKIQNEAFMTLPDGKPLSIVSKLKGFKEAERVTGPDLMEEIFKLSEEKGYTHYFYGSTNETLVKLEKKLIAKHPKLKIVGSYSPPFRELTEEEDMKIIMNINQIRPDFLWVGLGAQKQEIWMSKHKSKVNSLMIGVGAGFDYHAGILKRAPKWMQRLSLEWLYRLYQEPRRLFIRYFKTNAKFLIYILIKNL